MKTILGTEISKEICGIIYIIEFTGIKNTLITPFANKFNVVEEQMYCDKSSIMNKYMEISKSPSKAALIAIGDSHNEFNYMLAALHREIAKINS